ncbi:MAG: Rrf2 family transcriptional regulator [Acidaminococcaceae bacterium]|nr:Rrf2 family transcriptional regulator [Acidaminococcaceae bacterium]
MISTRGRYAIRVLLDLAENSNGNYIPMKDVALRQEISLKYLERIVPTLTKNNLVEGQHGKGGGYRLTRMPEEYTVWEILCLTEGDMAPVSCLKQGQTDCGRASECKTLPMWKEYYDITKRYFSEITIADLLNRKTEPMYII